MFACRIWWDDSLNPTFGQPIAQASCIISAIGQQTAGQTDRRQEFVGSSEIMAVARGDQE